MGATAVVPAMQSKSRRVHATNAKKLPAITITSPLRDYDGVPSDNRAFPPPSPDRCRRIASVDVMMHLCVRALTGSRGCARGELRGTRNEGVRGHREERKHGGEESGLHGDWRGVCMDRISEVGAHRRQCGNRVVSCRRKCVGMRRTDLVSHFIPTNQHRSP